MSKTRASFQILKHTFLIALSLLLAGSLSSQLSGQTVNTWTGNTSSTWGVATNWSLGAVPTNAHNVVINKNANITIGANYTINNLTIGNSVTVSFVSSGANRTITIDNTGSSIGTGCTLTLNGSSGGNRTMGIAFTGSNQTMSIAGTLALGTGLQGGIFNTTNSLTTVTGTLLNDVTGNTITSTAVTLTFASGGTYIHHLDGGTIPTATWNAASTCLVTGVTSTVPTLTSFDQTFGNFTWNCSAQTGQLDLASHLDAIAGDLTVSATNSGSIRLVNTAAGTAKVIAITRDLILNGGTVYLHGTGAMGANGSVTVNLGRNITLNGGTLNLNGCSDTQITGTTLNMPGNFTMGAGSSMTKSSTAVAKARFSGTTVQNFDKSGGTVTGAIDFSIISGAIVDFGTSVLDGTTATFNLNAGGTLVSANTSGSGALTTSGANGSIQVGGTRTYTAGANYVFDGVAPQLTGNGLTQNTPVANLTINNSSGVTLTASTTVSTVLTLTSGMLTTGTYSIILTSTATGAIAGANSSAYINGNVQRAIAAGANTYSFPVGTASGYAPMSVAFKAGTLAGTLIGTVTGSDHPDVDLSTIDPLQSVNRNWELTVNSGLATVSYDVTFSFNPGDLDAGSDWNNFILGKYASSAWSYPTVGSRTATTIQATGMTNFGSFQAGELAGVPTACLYSDNGSTPAIADVIPCIEMPSNPQTISTTFAAHQYFTMNVVKGLVYQIYTCNGSSPSSPLKMVVYKDDAPSDPYLAFTYSNTGNPCTSAINNVYTSFTPDFSGKVRVLINRKSDCSAVTPSGLTVMVNVSGGSNLQDNPTTAGTDKWIGHVYDGISFDNYLGYYALGAETFQESFGSGGTWPDVTSDDASCFNVYSGSDIRSSVKTSTFSVRYRMNSTKRGLYTASMTGDDGNRLSVDGSQVYSDWSDHSPRTNSNVLFSLTGASSLVFDYYENAAQNATGFNDLVLILANTLTTNKDQNICVGGTGAAISGDSFGSLPTGISLSGTGYQWTYSTSPGGGRIAISGATGATFTPSTANAPFNSPGTYYLYRNATLISTKNVSPNPYTATSESNAATILIGSPPTAQITYPGSPYCHSLATQQVVVLTGTTGGTFSATPSGLSINAVTGSISPSASLPGTYTVSYSLAAGSCGTMIATTEVTIIGNAIWTGAVNTSWNVPGNWYCGVIPDLTSDVEIPAVSNQPVLSEGAVGAVRNLQIGSGSSLTVTANTIQISGTVTNSGAFTVSGGAVEWLGSAAQYITPNLFAGNLIKDLIVNNNSGVILQGPLNVTGFVRCSAGNLSSSGNLTLVSTSLQTALVDGSGTGTITGNVTMQRYLPSGLGYKYFSSPFQAAGVDEFGDDLDLTAQFPAFYTYDEENHNDSAGIVRYTTGWIKYLTGTLVPLKGYAANFGSSVAPKTVDITGVVNNESTYSTTLYNHNRLYTKGFNLVGNPYPSPIDWDAPSGWTKTNIDNAVYYFDATDQYGGTYSTYINGISSDGLANSLIPAMQGFFVHVSDGNYPVTATLGLTNSVRTTHANPYFHKVAHTGFQPVIRLSAAFDQAGAPTDPTVIYFDALATREFNGELDALKLLNTDDQVPSLFTVSADKEWVSIKGMAYSVDSISEIPLGISTRKTGWIVIKASDLDNIPAGLHVYLFDTETGMNQDLQNSMQYRVYLPAGEYADRFRLKLSLVDLIDKPVAPDGFFAWFTGEDLRIKMKLDPEENALISVCNLMGQVVWRQEVSGEGYGEISKRLTTGIYVVSLYRKTGIQSQRIFIPYE
jgi:hypothetical protein